MEVRSSIALVTQSPRMHALLERVDAVARTGAGVLLVGETGVGKELFADYIHRSSPRAERPFVKVSLSAIPHELLESELFGHERGAFTHAISEKKGLFEVANGGSLFLDDIDDVPPDVQTRLLRVLESQEVMRVGATQAHPVDVRVIAASKVDLRGLVERGLFRADLFYRLNVFPAEIPPLRERTEDIPLLATHFLRRFAPNRSLRLSPAAEAALKAYRWPGNVRELRNIIQRVALFAADEIGESDLPSEVVTGHPAIELARACTRCMAEQSMTYSEVVACLETTLLQQALREAEGNQTHAAKRLGLSLSTLRDKMKKHGVAGEGC